MVFARWRHERYVGYRWTRQQDGAPSHTAGNTITRVPAELFVVKMSRLLGISSSDLLPMFAPERESQ